MIKPGDFYKYALFTELAVGVPVGLAVNSLIKGRMLPFSSRYDDATIGAMANNHALRSTGHGTGIDNETLGKQIKEKHEGDVTDLESKALPRFGGLTAGLAAGSLAGLVL